MLLLNIIFVEVIVLLGILIVYWLDYTYTYIHCHCRTEPCPKMTNYDKFKSEFGWIESSKTIDARNINDEDIKIFNLNDINIPETEEK